MSGVSPPSAARTALQRWSPGFLEARAIVHRAVTRQGGFVDKDLGDGVLAHFMDGPAEAQAHAALDAALDLGRRLSDWNRDRVRDGLPPMPVSTALHAGEVLAGVFNDGLRSEFTVLGPAMNALSRVERRAKDDGLDLVASKRFARLLPASARRDVGIGRLVRRAEDGGAPDMVRLDPGSGATAPPSGMVTMA